MRLETQIFFHVDMGSDSRAFSARVNSQWHGIVIVTFPAAMYKFRRN